MKPSIFPIHRDRSDLLKSQQSTKTPRVCFSDLVDDTITALHLLYSRTVQTCWEVFSTSETKKLGSVKKEKKALKK
jgi:hypothetical protein